MDVSHQGKKLAASFAPRTHNTRAMFLGRHPCPGWSADLFKAPPGASLTVGLSNGGEHDGRVKDGRVKKERVLAEPSDVRKGSLLWQ